MDKCHITDKDIERYLFGHMEEDEETAFQQHLLTCNKCSTKVRNLRNLAESFHPETIAREDVEEEHEPGRIVPFVQRMRPWLVAASVALLFAAGWMGGRYSMHDQLGDNSGLTKIETPPGYASDGTTKKEFTLVSPGEGRYLFNINETYSDENNIIFKWSPKASNALLVIKTNTGLWDEIRVKDTNHIKLNMTKYSGQKSLTWFLIVSESEEVMKGIIDLKMYLPPYVIDEK